MRNFYTDRAVVITGASSGIGRAMALRLGRQGALLGLVARRESLLGELAATIRESGTKVALAAADVSEREQVQAAMASLRTTLGPIDLLIANAGVGTPTLLNPVNIGDVERMIRVNVLGTIYSIEAVLPEMLARKSGHLAAVSSLAAFKGLPGESAYCASKAAINAYLEGLRIQLREHGIPVTLACPGFVATPMTAVNDFPMPFLMSAEQAADSILWAIQKRKAVYRFPLRMSLMMRMLNWLPDWVISRSMKSYNEKPPLNHLG